MKHVKLFEAFVNEAKVNSREFSKMFSKTISDIQKRAAGFNIEDAPSKENLLYVLMVAWKEVAEQNNFNEQMSGLNASFAKFKVKTDEKLGIVPLHRHGIEFGADAYGATAYHLDGMVECFGYVIKDHDLIKPAVWKKIEKFLLIEK